MRGFHCLAKLWLGGNRSRDYLPVCANLNAQSARHGATCRGANLYLLYRLPPCVPRSREREERPAGVKEKVADVQKMCV